MLDYTYPTRRLHLRLAWFFNYTFLAKLSRCDLEVNVNDPALVDVYTLHGLYSSRSLQMRPNGPSGLSQGIVYEAHQQSLRSRFRYLHLTTNRKEDDSDVQEEHGRSGR